jgi:hypothetical protein
MPQRLRLSSHQLPTLPSISTPLLCDHHARFDITLLSFIHPSSIAISSLAAKRRISVCRANGDEKEDIPGHKIIVWGKLISCGTKHETRDTKYLELSNVIYHQGIELKSFDYRTYHRRDQKTDGREESRLPRTENPA